MEISKFSIYVEIEKKKRLFKIPVEYSVEDFKRFIMNCCEETMSYLLTHEIQLVVDNNDLMIHKTKLLRKLIKDYQLLEVKFIPFTTCLIEENDDTPAIVSQNTQVSDDKEQNKDDFQVLSMITSSLINNE